MLTRVGVWIVMAAEAAWVLTACAAIALLFALVFGAI